MSFRLGLINPNTDEAMTAAMAAVARDALPDAEIVALQPDRGPASIESYVDEAIAAALVVDVVRRRPDLDAYVVACFGDPGVAAVRELTEAPVVGIREAAYRAVTLVARRFAVITTLRRGVPEIEEGLASEGVTDRCVGVIPLEIPVAEQGSAYPHTTDAIVAAGQRAVRDLGADGLVLACGGMADVARAVTERVGVPACDGVAVGVLMAHGVWRAGLRTSKAGGYGWPEPIPYRGMEAPSEARAG
jgi:allantoin racemase